MRVPSDIYLEHMTFRSFQRPLLAELFGPLVGLAEEWRAQGASEDEIGMTAFGFDYVERHNLAVNVGLFGGCEDIVLEETADYVLRRDKYGRRAKRYKWAAGGVHPLEYPVTGWDSWLRIKPRYQFAEERFSDGWAELARQARARQELVYVTMPGGFDEPRQLLGEEGLCLAMVDQPDLVHDMLTTIGDMVELVLERASRVVQIDQLSVHEDLAGKSGALIGPRQIREFVGPYYRRTWDMLAARGTRIFDQDSDGNINSVIPAFLETGINAMHPFEPAAGMDIVQIRRTYGPRLAIRGGLDKHVVRQGQEAIRSELEAKLLPLKDQAGIIFGLDHRIPNGTPIALYRYYVRTARELLGLDPNPAPAWGRMAF